ncbi:MAG: S8 family peptidase, partial [Bryobacterales bacterium]|nr:S8 family peptidase [Bryobacterales bacterium]
MRYATLVLLICSFTAAYGAERKLDPSLENLNSDRTVDVIVEFRQVPTEADHNRILARHGQLKHNLDIIKAAHYSVPASELEAISNDPDVEFIAPDRTVHAAGAPTPPAPPAPPTPPTPAPAPAPPTPAGPAGPAATIFTGNPDYGWRTVGADLATTVDGLSGIGVGVALLDSGTNNGPDFNDLQNHNRIVYSTSMVAGTDANDHYGHGTHVSGILAGTGFSSLGPNTTYWIRGVAPLANLISIKVLNDSGVGTDSTVIAGIQTAIQLQRKYNVRVINLSLGRPVSSSYLTDPLCLAVQQAWQAGIVVVVAAGNDGRDNSQGTSGYGTITAPGNSPYVITVGAMNTMGTLTETDDQITSYSSKGPTAIDQIVKPDLVAPGNQILSVNQPGSWLAQIYPANQVAKEVYTSITGPAGLTGNNYFVLSGTSMAAPMVSGAAALMIQQNPSLTPDQIKARLMKTATKLPPGFTTATDPVTGITYT